LLTAYVFYELFTGQPAVDLPYILEIEVAADSQQKLRDVASSVVESNHATCNEQVISNEGGRPIHTGIPALHPWGLVALCCLMAGVGGLSLRRKRGQR
jgi:hypothetical protein